MDLFGITLVGILIEYEAFFVSLCVKSKSPLNHIRNSCCSTLLHLKLFVFENNFFFTNQRDDKNVNSVNFKVALLPWERFLIIKTKKTNNKLTFTVNICSLFLFLLSDNICNVIFWTSQIHEIKNIIDYFWWYLARQIVSVSFPSL